MTRVVWLTDIHLNFLLAEQSKAFLASVAQVAPDAVLIGGDIAESHDICDYLRQIQNQIPAPIYFVLGNHDYYRSSIASVRRQVQDLCVELPRLRFLTVGGVEKISPRVGLVGHDGWADGRAGDYLRSLVEMHDYHWIAELAGRNKLDRWEVLKSLAEEAAAHFRRVLPVALQQYEQVVLLTHVPPLRSACWHQGQISNDEWAPHFTSLAVGEVIVQVMSDWPARQLTVLCGHTHGGGETRPLPNVRIITGAAEYGRPTIAGVFEFE